MKNTHTPGPWTISGTHHSIGIAPDDGKSDGLASVFGCGPQAEANARLIAAAPELLSALEAAYNAIAWDIPGGNLSDQEEDALLDVIREALRKAKGEA